MTGFGPERAAMPGMALLERQAFDLSTLAGKVTAVERELPGKISESLLVSDGQIIRRVSGVPAAGNEAGQLVPSGRVIRTTTWTSGSLAASAISGSIETITITGNNVDKVEVTVSGINYLASAAFPFYFQLWDNTSSVAFGASDQQPPVVNTRSSAVVIGELAPFSGSKTIQLRVVNYTGGTITVQGDATAITSAKPLRMIAKWISA